MFRNAPKHISNIWDSRLYKNKMDLANANFIFKSSERHTNECKFKTGKKTTTTTTEMRCASFFSSSHSEIARIEISLVARAVFFIYILCVCVCVGRLSHIHWLAQFRDGDRILAAQIKPTRICKYRCQSRALKSLVWIRLLVKYIYSYKKRANICMLHRIC